MEGACSNPGFLQLDFIEEGRREIFTWRDKRHSKRSGLQGRIYAITKLFIDKSLVRSFTSNLSIVVGFQMLLAALCTYACVTLNLEFDVQMSLFVSPIVFPLAFSINANYQRRETVLEDLAMFKAASLILFFCHRDWIKAIGLPVDLLKTLSNKLKFLVINIREYLLTEDSQKRKVILQAVYEDFSDVSQLNDKLRASELKSNSSLISRIIHCHNLMCWSFEKLRVIREYKSPRSLRSFTKMFIFLMPLLLSPYYVYSGRQTNSAWAPYFISVLVSFLFGSLQAVQDKLDDPFDGIGEDDVNLGQLDDWTTQSLLTNRTVTVGRFTVTTTSAKDENADSTSPLQARLKQHEESLNQKGSPKKARRLSRKSERNLESRKATCVGLNDKEFSNQLEARCHGIASKLEGLTGSTTILPGNRTPYLFHEMQGLKSPDVTSVIPGGPTTEIKSENVTDEGETSESDRERNVRFNLSGQNGLEVLREREEEEHGMEISLPNNLFITNDDAVLKRIEGEDEKRPTVMELFSNKLNTTTQNYESPSDESERVSTHEGREQLLLLSRKDTSSTLIHSPTTSCDSSDEQDACDSLTPPCSQSRVAETERNNVPKLRFAFGGKRRAWSMPEGLSKWRKRRYKKKRSSLETIDQVGSETELKMTSSMSPLLPNVTTSEEGHDHKSSEKTPLDNNRPSEIKPNEANPPDNVSPSSGNKVSRFAVSRNTSDQGSGKNTNSEKVGGSRFNVSPS